MIKLTKFETIQVILKEKSNKKDPKFCECIWIFVLCFLTENKNFATKRKKKQSTTGLDVLCGGVLLFFVTTVWVQGSKGRRFVYHQTGAGTGDPIDGRSSTPQKCKFNVLTYLIFLFCKKFYRYIIRGSILTIFYYSLMTNTCNFCLFYNFIF